MRIALINLILMFYFVSYVTSTGLLIFRYFMQAYVPTYLTIFISWVSFSLGPKAIPARTMLGVNALLVRIILYS